MSPQIGNHRMRARHMRCSAIAVLLSLLACSFAFAQGVFQSSSARTQPLVTVRDGDYINCGVRVVSVQDSDGHYPVRAVDYSVGIWLREPEMAIGMAKFVAWRISSETEMKTAGGSQLQVVDGWVRSESGGPLRPHPLARPIPGEDPQTLLLFTEAIDTAEFLKGVLDPARVLVGIRAKDDKVDWVLAHEIRLESGDRRTLAACLSGLLARASKQLRRKRRCHVSRRIQRRIERRIQKTPARKASTGAGVDAGPGHQMKSVH